MRHKAEKYLFDIQHAIELLQRFTAGKSFEEYIGDEMLRSAVERQFEIIGEALNQAIQIDPSLSSHIPRAREIISFRNRLIHGYATVNHEIVWAIITDDIPRFSIEIQALLKSG